VSARKIRILRAVLLGAAGACYGVAIDNAFSHDLGVTIGALSAGAALLALDLFAARLHLAAAMRRPGSETGAADGAALEPHARKGTP
jgi:hypothetical protein